MTDRSTRDAGHGETIGHTSISPALRSRLLSELIDDEMCDRALDALHEDLRMSLPDANAALNTVLIVLLDDAT